MLNKEALSMKITLVANTASYPEIIEPDVPL